MTIGEHGPEMVNHPQHYNLHPAGIECIDVIEEMTFNVGSAIKYAWRAGLKPGASMDEDLRKAIWYLERERTRLNTVTKNRQRLYQQGIQDAYLKGTNDGVATHKRATELGVPNAAIYFGTDRESAETNASEGSSRAGEP